MSTKEVLKCDVCKFQRQGDFCILNNCVVSGVIKKYGCDKWQLEGKHDDGKEPLGNNAPIIPECDSFYSEYCREFSGPGADR